MDAGRRRQCGKLRMVDLSKSRRTLDQPVAPKKTACPWAKVEPPTPCIPAPPETTTQDSATASPLQERSTDRMDALPGFHIAASTPVAAPSQEPSEYAEKRNDDSGCEGEDELSPQLPTVVWFTISPDDTASDSATWDSLSTTSSEEFSHEKPLAEEQAPKPVPQCSPWKPIPVPENRSEEAIWGQLDQPLPTTAPRFNILKRSQRSRSPSPQSSDSGCENEPDGSSYAEQEGLPLPRINKERAKAIWRQPLELFQQTISTLTPVELGQLGRNVPQAFGQYNLLQAFYGRVSDVLPETLKDITWLPGALRPLSKAGLYKDSLAVSICDRLEQGLNQEPAREYPIEVLANIMDILARTDFIHPVFINIASKAYKRYMPLNDRSFHGFLRLGRQLMIIHALACERGEVDLAQKVHHTLTSCITLAQLFKDSRNYSITHSENDMVHWLRLYGYHVLKMQIASPEPLDLETSATVSDFQKKVSKALRQQLPSIQLVDEKMIPGTGLSADIFCEPNVVVEVDGIAHHFRQKLFDSTVRCPDPVPRETGKTILKRRILCHAGFTVINITDTCLETIQNVAGRITLLRAEAKLPVRPHLLQRPPAHSVARDIASTVALPPAEPFKLNPAASAFIPEALKPKLIPC